MSTENYEVVYVSGNGKTRPYDPDKDRMEVNNFLVFEGLIIIGWYMFHNVLLRRYYQATPHSTRDSSDLIGAGNCGEDGTITGWRSMGYGVTTPEDLRPGICDSLSMAESAE